MGTAELVFGILSLMAVFAVCVAFFVLCYEA